MFIIVFQMLGLQYSFSPVLYCINKVIQETLYFEV